MILAHHPLLLSTFPPTHSPIFFPSSYFRLSILPYYHLSLTFPHFHPFLPSPPPISTSYPSLSILFLLQFPLIHRSSSLLFSRHVAADNSSIVSLVPLPPLPPFLLQIYLFSHPWSRELQRWPRTESRELELIWNRVWQGDTLSMCV